MGREGRKRTKEKERTKLSDCTTYCSHIVALVDLPDLDFPLIFSPHSLLLSFPPPNHLYPLESNVPNPPPRILHHHTHGHRLEQRAPLYCFSLFWSTFLSRAGWRAGFARLTFPLSPISQSARRLEDQDTPRVDSFAAKTSPSVCFYLHLLLGLFFLSFFPPFRPRRLQRSTPLNSLNKESRLGNRTVVRPTELGGNETKQNSFGGEGARKCETSPPRHRLTFSAESLLPLAPPDKSCEQAKLSNRINTQETAIQKKRKRHE